MFDLDPLEKTEVRKFMPRHYVVTGNIPSDKRSQHRRFAVVCADVKRAIELAEAANPGIVVSAVASQGPIDKVDTNG